MKKSRRPMKPSKAAVWNKEKKRWELDSAKIMQMDIERRLTQGVTFDCRDGTNIMRKLIPKKPKKRLKPKSETQKKEDALYEKLKPIWRKNPKHHFCQALCKDHHIHTPALPYPHHIRGRGKLLNAIEFWLPICFPCHTFIEQNRAVARKRGWLSSRDAKAIKNAT
jgi:hypothetical protein